MLIVYDDKGEIGIIITLGESVLMEQAYANMGMKTYRSDLLMDVTGKYVKDGQPVDRPIITIDPFALRANEETNVVVSDYTDETRVEVFHEGLPVGTETFSGGQWSIEVDAIGKYIFVFHPVFPYMPVTVEIEVTE